MSGGTVSYQNHGADICVVRRLNCECAAITHFDRCTRDDWSNGGNNVPMAVEREEIGRRIELDVLLVSSLRRVAPDHLYCAVRHEQRARVIKPRIRRHT